MRMLLVGLVLVACSHTNPAPVTPPSNTSTTENQMPATGACEQDGMTIWDATANECRLYPGGPYGHAGCSERTTEAPGKCFTGSSWDGHCDCACDAGAWDDTAHACK